MANVQDVAAYIIKNFGSMTAMKLQKLAYYSQAWNLVWDDRPLFDSRIEAWANGPVVLDLYRKHRGQFTITEWPSGDASKLNLDESETVDAVYASYGKFNAHQLSEMTHREDPWKLARTGLSDGQRSGTAISDASMHEYYHGLSN